MNRIKDYYNWKRLEQWKMVLDKGNVGWRYINPVEVNDAILEEAVMLLKNDCFPIAIVCCCKEDRCKEIMGTPLWNGIFSFLESRRCIKIGGHEVFFKDLNALERKKILDAQISSIWVRD